MNPVGLMWYCRQLAGAEKNETKRLGGGFRVQTSIDRPAFDLSDSDLPSAWEIEGFRGGHCDRYWEIQIPVLVHVDINVLSGVFAADSRN